jgi:hypothetical protein
MPPIPTVPVEEARTKLLDLLANNGNCRLPCVWGIAPGKSSFLEARTILLPLYGISSQIYVHSISPSYDEGELSIYTSLHFLTGTYDDIVSSISFQVEAHKKTPDGYENIFDSTFFGERVGFYELPSVLSQHGIPDSVFIGTLAGFFRDGGSWGFHILLMYPDQGMLINYTTQMQIIGKNILGCQSNAHVEFELYPSGEGDLFFTLLEPTNWPQNIKSNYKPLEEVTSMTLDGFYQTFRQPTNICIETPGNLWPTPEP